MMTLLLNRKQWAVTLLLVLVFVMTSISSQAQELTGENTANSAAESMPLETDELDWTRLPAEGPNIYPDMEPAAPSNLPLFRARVLDVSMEQALDEFAYDVQLVTLEILTGPDRGKIVNSSSVITGSPYYDMLLEPGQRILVHSDPQAPAPDGTIEYFPADFVRDRTVYWLAAIFFLLLVAIGGFKGLKALLSLGIMGALVFYVMLPLLLAGWNPILIAVSVTSVGALIFLLLVGGANQKTAAAIGGTITGLLLGGILAAVAGHAAQLSGLSSSEAQILQYLGPGIDFRGLLFAGIILGALGAALDVGMSISSAMEQIYRADPSLSRKDLVQRGFHVGRDILGTMANTLILAYVGSSLPLLLLFYWQDAGWNRLINMDLIASEIVRALAGSIGLALAVPATALIAGLLLHRPTAASPADTRHQK